MESEGPSDQMAHGCDGAVLRRARNRVDSRGFRATQRGMTMSKSRSYIRSDDSAMMIEVEPYQYVNAKILQAQGRNPSGQRRDEEAAASDRRSTT